MLQILNGWVKFLETFKEQSITASNNQRTAMIIGLIDNLKAIDNISQIQPLIDYSNEQITKNTAAYKANSNLTNELKWQNTIYTQTNSFLKSVQDSMFYHSTKIQKNNWLVLIGKNTELSINLKNIKLLEITSTNVKIVLGHNIEYKIITENETQSKNVIRDIMLAEENLTQLDFVVISTDRFGTSTLLESSR